MDLSFSRRRKATPRVGTPDLDGMLSAAAARQAASPTGRAAARLGHGSASAHAEDPLIDLFAASGQETVHPPHAASFSPHLPPTLAAASDAIVTADDPPLNQSQSS